MRVGWIEHCRPYLASGVLWVKYEDMLADAPEECSQNLRFLELTRTKEQIETAIANQSFSLRKRQFRVYEESSQVRLMRSGTCGQWKQERSCKQIALFEEVCGDDLRRLYPENESGSNDVDD